MLARALEGKLQGSWRASDIHVTLCFSFKSINESSKDHSGCIQHLLEQVFSEVVCVLYPKQNSGDLQAHKHLNVGALLWIRARSKQLSDLENNHRTETLLPGQPSTMAHFLSCYLQRHLQSQLSLPLIFSILCASNQVRMMKTHETWGCQKKICTTINCCTSTSDLSRTVTCQA